ncbi:PREDICTED: uncharacterized protein LOC109476930 [Branchiostoma belcheri]|uniref:Uncharacterized protein LOC109476930 n=1 Tax=Branchiostoma belcheri TaxID=7741 RepID=A0A6P4YVY0_BRABE|nr:PREDICTED: uncharacterized protein LOC109476930 [Branchiostoma belcheri]
MAHYKTELKPRLTQPHWSFVTTARRIWRAEIVRGGQIFSWVFCSIKGWLLGRDCLGTARLDDQALPRWRLYAVISRHGMGLELCFHGMVMVRVLVHVAASVIHQ